MPAIIAPAPRLPQDTQLLPPPRLLSPFRLHEPPYINSKSPTPCAPPHKRRAPSRLSARSTRRRRHSQRLDCPFDAFVRPSLFDQLPWISSLELPSPATCDLADLSQLPVHEFPVAFSDSIPASGPVRRRKTSLRSSPLGTGHGSPPGDLPTRQQLPIRRSTDPLPDPPRTPPPHVLFDPSRVTFHNLMPVFPRGINPSTPF